MSFAAGNIPAAPSPIRLDPFGNVWMNRYGKNYFRCSGDLASQVDFGVGGNDITFDPMDNVLVLQNTEVRVYSRDGAFISSYPVPAGGFSVPLSQYIFVDGSNTPVILTANMTQAAEPIWAVTKVRDDGTMLAQYVRSNPQGVTSPGLDTAIPKIVEGGNGTFWVLDQRLNRLIKLSSDLTVLVDVPVYDHSLALAMVPGGKPYVYTPIPGQGAYLTRYGPNGAVEAVAALPPYAVQWMEYYFAVDSDGGAWLPQGASIDKYTF
jgi:hypothetical protein